MDQRGAAAPGAIIIGMAVEGQGRGEPPPTSARDTWTRGLFMLLFVVAYGVAEAVLTVVVIFQFISTLFVQRPNERLLRLGQGLSTYVYEILSFLTFNSEEKPYPFGPWPGGPPAA